MKRWAGSGLRNSAGLLWIRALSFCCIETQLGRKRKVCRQEDGRGLLSKVRREVGRIDEKDTLFLPAHLHPHVALPSA